MICDECSKEIEKTLYKLNVSDPEDIDLTETPEGENYNFCSYNCFKTTVMRWE